MPTLVLLPGLDGTGIQFKPFINALGGCYKVQVISYPADKRLDYAELIVIVTKRLPKLENYFLLGESFSGPIAIAIAATKPVGLAGLILCCPFARNPLPKLTKLNFLIDWLPFILPPGQILNYLLLGEFSTPILISSLKNSLELVSSQTLKSRLKSVLTVDKTTELEKLNIPVLYLQALDDRLIPKSAGNLIKHLYKRTRLVNLEAPHLLLQTKPGEAVQIIRSFIDETLSDDEKISQLLSH